MAFALRTVCSLLLAGISTVVLPIITGGAAFAATTAVDHASAYVLDTSFGDAQSLLSFEIGGMGFQPGEPVVIRVSVVVGPNATAAVSLPPVRATTNAYGEFSATVDGSTTRNTGSGYLIRVTGPHHQASVVNLIGSAASEFSPASTISVVR